MEIDRYLGLMEEIKRRSEAVHEIITKRKTTSYVATNIEFNCLQIRKILELIALANLVANKHHFEEQKAKFEKFWRAKQILTDIEKLNPDFYPKPINEVDDTNPKIKKRLEDLTSGFLTRDEFADIYDKCSALIHATNPYSAAVNLDEYEKEIPKWLEKTKVLLKAHIIRLVNSDDFYLIHMAEKDGKAHGYTFGKVK
jgi:hypothetical protein